CKMASFVFVFMMIFIANFTHKGEARQLQEPNNLEIFYSLGHTFVHQDGLMHHHHHHHHQEKRLPQTLKNQNSGLGLVFLFLMDITSVKDHIQDPPHHHHHHQPHHQQLLHLQALFNFLE
ncbi:hypothetical protein Pfo_024564, partial [Paulownia fortunei]